MKNDYYIYIQAVTSYTTAMNYHIVYDEMKDYKNILQKNKYSPPWYILLNCVRIRNMSKIVHEKYE